MEPIEIAVSGTVAGWLESAVAHIDELMGEGFSAANPALVGDFIRASATAALTARLGDMAADISGVLDARLEQIAHARSE